MSEPDDKPKLATGLAVNTARAPSATSAAVIVSVIFSPASYASLSNAHASVLAVTARTVTTEVVTTVPAVSVIVAVPTFTPVTVATAPEYVTEATVASDDAAAVSVGVAVAFAFTSAPATVRVPVDPTAMFLFDAVTDIVVIVPTNLNDFVITIVPAVIVIVDVPVRPSEYRWNSESEPAAAATVTEGPRAAPPDETVSTAPAPDTATVTAFDPAVLMASNFAASWNCFTEIRATGVADAVPEAESVVESAVATEPAVVLMNAVAANRS